MSSMLSALQAASAENWPTLWPMTTSGSTPSRSRSLRYERFMAVTASWVFEVMDRTSSFWFVQRSCMSMPDSSDAVSKISLTAP